MAVAYDHPTPKGARVPAHIEQKWRSDLSLLLREDLLQGLGGARRHSPSAEYDIMYRLDVSDEALHATGQRLSGLSTGSAPSFDEVLSSAKIWLSFNEDASDLLTHSALASSALEATTIPASPALSTLSVDTLVGEDCEADVLKMKIKLLEDDILQDDKSFIRTPIPESTVGCFERVFGSVHPNGPPRRRRSNKKNQFTALSESKLIQSSFSSIDDYVPLVDAISTSSVSGSDYPWFENGAEYDLIAQCY